MNDLSTKPRLLTVGRVAEILDEPVRRIEYLLRTRPDIQPCAYAGNARLFDKAGLERIQHELSGMESRRNAEVKDVCTT
jgi:hypothetical protein